MTTQIQNLLNEAKLKGIAKVSTCDAPNWDRKLHDDLLIYRRRNPQDYSITYTINWGVWDWVIIYCG